MSMVIGKTKSPFLEIRMSGSMTCPISENSISILYDFNDKNIDLEKISELLNSLTAGYNLL